MNVKTQPLIGCQTNGAGLVNHLQPKAGPGTLISLLGFNSGPAQFIQLHDSAGVPAENSVPLFAFAVPSGQHFNLDTPVKFSAAIFVCNSSTLAVKTIGAADCFIITRNI